VTHLELMVSWFKHRGGRATLRDILACGEPWSYEFRARATDLRKKGYVITCERADQPSNNTYRLVPPDGAQMRWI
jgi:hypothetical protein